MTDFDHATESDEIPVIDFVATHQLRVVPKVSKEPSEPPQGLRGAIDAAGKSFTLERLRFEDDKSENVKRLLSVPVILGALDANEEHSVGHRAIRGSISLMQTLEASSHAAPSFAGM
jgi:hypothetical protein